MVRCPLFSLAALALAAPTLAAELPPPHPQVDLALSDSVLPDKLEVRVAVGDDELSVDGARVQHLDAGNRVPDAAKRGSLIVPLYDVLRDKVETERTLELRGGPPFEGHLLLAIAADVPYATATDVLYTAGQAQLNQLLFQVSGPSPSGPGGPSTFLIRSSLPMIVALGQQTPARDSYVAVVRVEPDQVVVLQHGPTTPELQLERTPPTAEHRIPNLASGPDYAALEALMKELKKTCEACERVIIQPRPEDSWQTVISLLDATRESGGQALFPGPVLARQVD